jgi:hypothetical protein
MARERLSPFAVASRKAPEARGADVGLEQVLLEEHPGVDMRPLDAVVREERRPLREVEEDRAGLGDRGAALRDEERRAAGRVERAAGPACEIDVARTTG